MNYKPFVYKTYPNENYYVRRRENLMTMYADIVAYFDQHLKQGRVMTAGAGGAR
jgi:dipeptidyl aminopeptidase/acylaminoacyl peptidase